MEEIHGFRPIGTIHTPYGETAPFTNFEEAEGEFWVEVDDRYREALYLLDKFRYVYLVFFLDRGREPKLKVQPPRGKGITVGLFASRSPNRFNPIGLTIARILRIEGGRIYTSGLDILDRTPLLDLKPYIRDFDCKEDANMGWIEP